MINKQDLLALMKARHSGRLYDPNKVINQAEINMLIEAARFSPSCFGDEPWRYVICNKQNNQSSWERLLSCLDESNQKWAKNAQVLIISLSAKNFRKLDKGKNFWAKHDTGAANYALMLQAASMNLMAHQMGGFDKDKIIEKFNIPDDFNVMSVVAVGYEEEGAEVKEKKRRPIEEIFFYDEWPKP
ncbi:nitroreductase family protein [Wolbachia endosymbiont of Ctenocephalides felis wCfeJ]|uniref:nitroreductase family protein n=1 Tax=Wolbachia endosymbiont of Ctenocephalides felis wCfeJ TaxID=2732594 RepID=UPI00144742BE|nr:nitroreductase family protein [Wolbachia endosymbiont of Ctenocephalides felis wCfeJ]WCR58576.1 MAG: Putative NAD(P)H nitroreductase [Wolbachia endosymbiont of Ctenocephalides felis wCfeJ]